MKKKFKKKTSKLKQKHIKKHKTIKRIKTFKRIKTTTNIMLGGAITIFLEKYNKTIETSGNKSKRKSINDINNSNIVDIGRGGLGIVYLDKKQPNSVFKVSKRTQTCREWGKEHEIYKHINSFNINTKLCKILKMKDYLSTDNICAIELTRAYNPRGEDHYYAIHPQFQLDDLDYKNKDRGVFLGINNLLAENIFTKDNIKDYIKDLGIIMSRLHYKVKNDGYDIELFVSKKNEKVTIYIADFDLSDIYTEPDIDRLHWSLENVPYFPIEGPLYDIFKNAYLKEAKKYNMEDIAKKVFELYS
jgi:hypothetical protein